MNVCSAYGTRFEPMETKTPRRYYNVKVVCLIPNTLLCRFVSSLIMLLAYEDISTDHLLYWSKCVQ